MNESAFQSFDLLLDVVTWLGMVVLFCCPITSVVRLRDNPKYMWEFLFFPMQNIHVLDIPYGYLMFVSFDIVTFILISQVWIFWQFGTYLGNASAKVALSSTPCTPSIAPLVVLASSSQDQCLYRSSSHWSKRFPSLSRIHTRKPLSTLNALNGFPCFLLLNF